MNEQARKLPSFLLLLVAICNAHTPVRAQEASAPATRFVNPPDVWIAPHAGLFGVSVVNLGDLDLDGEEEIAVGAPRATFAGEEAGAVFIISIPSGRLVRTIPGPPGFGMLGWKLRALHLQPNGVAPLLSIEGGRSSNQALTVDPTTGAIAFELPGVKTVQGVQNDLDGDGVREIVVTSKRATTVVEALSGASGQPIEASALPANAQLIEFDVDGDGYFDFYRAPRGFDTELEFISAVSKSVLTRLPLTAILAPRPFSFATAVADADGDGRSDLLLYCSDIAENASQLFAFQGSRFESRKIFAHHYELPRRAALAFPKAMCNLGDVNGDGADDLVIPCAAEGKEALACHSGSDGSTLWEVRGDASAEWSSIDRMKDIDGDGIAEVICGRVALPRDDKHPFIPGRVSLLSGKTGATLKVIDANWQVSRRRETKSELSGKKKSRSPALESGLGDSEYSLFALSVASLGDTDGDGEQEIAVAAPAAWTDAGRTGAVLILGATHGRLLRTLTGSRHDGEFGYSVRALRAPGESKATGLLVSDGREILLFDTTNWNVRSKTPSQPPDSSIDLDFDGDGIADRYREPRSSDTELALMSGSTQAELIRLPMGNPRGERIDAGRFTTLAADFDGDARNDLAVVWPDPEAHTSKILVFSGAKLEKRISIDLGKQDSYWLAWRELFTCGDLNLDGRDDLLAAQSEFPYCSVTCYSGADGSKLWKTEEVVDDEPSVDRLSDFDGDGVSEVLTGKVHYSTMGGYGDGVVFVLSGRTGRVVKQFVEGDYPTISWASYRESRNR